MDEFEPLHPHARWLLRLRAGLIALPPSIGLVVGATLLAAARLGADPKQWIMWLGLTLPLAALALAWWYGGARYRHAGYSLDEAGLRIRDGVFFRRETHVARARVQHTDINQGPLDRKLGLAELKIYTAGTRLASIELAGLPAARAAELRDALVGGADDAL